MDRSSRHVQLSRFISRVWAVIPAADGRITDIRRLAIVCASVLLALTACSGIDFGDNPGPDVSKQVGPLTALPAHLRDGSVP